LTVTLTLVLQAVTLVSIFYSIFKIVNRNTEEWRQRESRMQLLETDVRSLNTYSATIVKVDTKLGELTTEIERVRNRLDAFLDKTNRNC
jgi:hypothetical protein